MATKMLRQLIALGALSLCGVAPATLAHAQVGFSGARLNAENMNIELNVGEQRVLSAQGVKSYSEGVRGVVDLRLTGDASRFVMVGTAKGSTTLLLLMVDGSERQYNITVRDPRDTGESAGEVNPLAVSPQASIRLDLYFVQVNRTRSLDLGINMPSRLGAATFAAQYSIPAAALVSKTAVVGTSFVPTLDAAQAQGWAKISRHVTVITANGTQADFDSGGEFNAPSSSGLVAGVATIRYGTNLTILPKYDQGSGRIEMQVAASISDLTPGAPLPGRTQSKVATIANLALGESLAVAGLSTANQERNRIGLPWLSQIPLIGLLFSKQADKASESENLVFISPSVVEPLKHARAREFVSNAFREYEDFEGKRGEGKLFPGAKREVQAQVSPKK